HSLLRAWRRVTSLCQCRNESLGHRHCGVLRSPASYGAAHTCDSPLGKDSRPSCRRVVPPAHLQRFALAKTSWLPTLACLEACARPPVDGTLTVSSECNGATLSLR